MHKVKNGMSCSFLTFTYPCYLCISVKKLYLKTILITQAWRMKEGYFLTFLQFLASSAVNKFCHKLLVNMAVRYSYIHVCIQECYVFYNFMHVEYIDKHVY